MLGDCFGLLLIICIRLCTEPVCEYGCFVYIHVSGNNALIGDIPTELGNLELLSTLTLSK